MPRGNQVILKTRTFATQTSAGDYFSAILHKYKTGERVNEMDGADLAALLMRHPRSTEKIGIGVAYFEVRTSDYGSPCFRAVRHDDTWADFSYKRCVAPNSK